MVEVVQVIGQITSTTSPYFAYFPAPRKCSDTYSSSPTTQLSCGSDGTWKRVPGRRSCTFPSANCTVACPETTRPRCSTVHRSAPTVGPTWSDQRHPGS